MTYKICKVCQTYRVAHFELAKCHSCYWDGVALDRLERDMGEAERLRKKADEALEAQENSND